MSSAVKDRRVTLGLAGGVWVLFDLIRAWTPTLITVFGQAASTPPEAIGAFALGCLLVPVVVLWWHGRRPGHGGMVPGVALALAVWARLFVQLIQGGHLHLIVASIGVVAGVVWLAIALRRAGRDAVVALAVGFALSVVSHAFLGTWGTVWRHDGWSAALVVVQVVLVAIGLGAGRATPEDRGTGSGRALGWLVMPGIFVAGVVVANAGRASATAGWLGLCLISVGAVLAIAVSVLSARRWSAAVAGVVLVVVVATNLLITADAQIPQVMVVGYAVGLPALMHVWRAVDDGSGASSRAVAGGGVVWVLLLFAYYAGYDLGYRADWLVVAVAIVLAAAGVLRVRTATDGPAVGLRPHVLLSVTAIVAGVVAAVGPAVTIRQVTLPYRVTSGDATSVTAYNLRMGYGMDGSFRPDEVAEILGLGSVSLISEVDRGWYLNGGQDQLAILERLTGGTAWFGPAADPVWGDAVLFNPGQGDRVTIERHVLPSHGAVTGAQAIVVTEMGSNDRPITYVATHLQPTDGDEGVTEQAEDLAEILADLVSGGASVVVGGDFNMQPDSTAYRTIVAAGLVDAMPDGKPTSPADHPTKRIDFLFSTPDLVRTWSGVVRVDLSDHRPVQVSFDRVR